MPLIAVRLDLSNASLNLFDAYEAQVLPLLADHGGSLLRRHRDKTRNHELHLIGFADLRGLECFLADPRRTALSSLREQSRVTSRVRVFG